MKHNRKLGIRNVSVPPVRGTWGVWVADGLFITPPPSNTLRPPSRFHRWMMKLLLGWRWEQTK